MNSYLPVFIRFNLRTFIFLSAMLFSISKEVKAQCLNDNTFWLASGTIPCGTDASISMGAGTYSTFPVISGATYVFRTCGSSAITGSTFDTQLTGYDGSGNLLFYNDDAGGTCTNCVSALCSDPGSTNRESYLEWTATFAGTIRVNVDLWNCNACTFTNCPSLGSAALRYRQLNTIAFTSSSADMCSGSTRTLTATPAGGTFSGTGVSGNVFTAPASAGTYTITYTFGLCSSTQQIVVKSLSTAATTANTSNSTLCTTSGSNSVTLSQSGGTLGTNANWVWYSDSCGGAFVGNGSSLNVTPPIGTTTYYVRAEGDCNNTICRSVAVTRYDSTSVVAGSTLSTCQSATPAPITLTGASIGGSATTGTWSVISGGGTLSNTSPTASPQTVTYTPAANYTGSVTLQLTTDSTLPCTSKSTQRTIVVNPLPATAPASNSPVCEGNQINLSANASAGTPAYQYTWSGPLSYTSSTAAPSITNATPSMSGSYSVTVTDANLCSVSSAVAVTVNPNPNGSILGSGIVCSGVTDTVLTFNFSIGTSPFDITYTNGSNSFSKTGVVNGDTIHINPSSTVTYSFLQIADANGCIRTSGFLGSATVTVAPLPAVISVTSTDVLCFGGSTGTISVNAGSGTPPYSYSIDSGGSYQVSSSFPGLGIGSYNVAISDFYNCKNTYVSNPVVINQPTQLTHTDTFIDASCANVFDGSITVNATGGTPPYLYSINGGPAQSGNTFNGLAAGSYNVVVEDDNGCTDNSTVVISNVYTVSGSIISQTDVSCFGGVDGTVTLELTGGIPPYSYSINGVIFQASPTFTGLASGNYVATLRDSKGCTEFVGVTIQQPAQLQVLIDSVGDILCSGGNNGSVSITVVGGTAPYSFLWSNADTTEDVSNLSAGTYNVSVTDSKGCNSSGGVTISQPAPLYLTVASFHNLVCNNDSSGEIDVTVNGGVPPYNFVWNNGSVFEDVFALPAGSYEVTVNDANGCADTVYQTLTEPTLLTSTVTSVDASCSGASNGSIDLEVFGGTPVYSYFWSNGASSQDISNIAAGTYTVMITDANGCTISNSATINQTGAISLATSVTKVACNADSSGQIILTVTGGTVPFSYVWTNGATTKDLTNVPAGTYSVVVTDSNSCSASTTATVFQPVGIILSATTTSASCFGVNDGAVDLTVQGGTVPYSYLWSDASTTQDLTGVAGGSYSVTVTDVSSCTATFSVLVNQAPAMAINGIVSNISCGGYANGSVILSVQGGSFPYGYLWSNTQTTKDISGLSGGSYSVTVTDAGTCTAEETFTITEPTSITTTATGTNVTCFGGADGTADLTVSGGTTPYTFLWNSFQNTEDVSNLTAGINYVIVTDANGCEARDSVIINQPSQIVLSLVVSNSACGGVGSGSIDMTVSGGTPGYTYLWSTTDTTEDISGLSPGTYSVIVTDASSCTASAFASVAQITGLAINSTVKDVNCFGGSDGEVDITVQGGAVPYQFAWSSGAVTEDAYNLSAGSTSVTVTDANLCTLTQSFTLTEPTAITSSVSGTDVTCSGSNDGSIDLTVSGGTTPYSFLWNTFQSTEDLNGIGGGNYFVVITDDNGCEKRDSIVINEPTTITISTTVTNATCFGDSTGAISITVNGGTGSYTYLWSEGSITQNISGVPTGNYTVTVTDASSCSATASAMVAQPTQLIVVGNVTDVTCAGYSNGSIDITVQGGTFPYSYSWTNSAITEDISNLMAGVYDVTVTDANTCSATSSFTVSEPTGITSSVVSTNVTCPASKDGTADLIVSGGTQPYTFLWSTLQNAEDLDSLNGGTYFVVITDATGCQKRDSAIISEPAPFSIAAVVTPVACNGDSTGAIDLTVAGGTQPYNYTWSNAETTQDISSLYGGNYTVSILDANSCSISSSYSIANPTLLTITLTKTDPLCYGDPNGAINLTTSGGTPGYTFLWSNTATTEDLDSLVASQYDVTVSDANSCTVTGSSVLVDPAPFYVSGVVSHISCFGNQDGEIDITAYGGTLPYAFSWSPSGQSTEDLWNLPGGSDTVRVTDAHGCEAASVYTVNEPQPLTANAVSTNASCYQGSNGTVAVVPGGGTQPYTYLWNTFDTDSSLVNVSAGRYIVQVVDSNGCFTYDTTHVTEPTEIIINAVITHARCFGDSTGSIDVSISGGAGVYIFSWSNGATTEDISGVPAGTYLFTATDTFGCSKSASFTVNDGKQIFVALATVEPVCNGGSDGSITAIVNGGDLPYAYAWSNPQQSTTVSIGNLQAGVYTVTVKDVANCSAEATDTLRNPLPITLDITTTGAVCYNTSTGTVTVAVNGGTAPYNYLLNGAAQDTGIFVNLSSGHYIVYVSDVNGCQGTDSFTISEPSEITVDLGVTQQVILTGMQTQLVATANSTAPVINYVWYPDSVADFSICADITNCPNPYVAPRTTTIFMVTVMNQDSCYASDTITVYVNNEPSKFIPTAFTPNGDGLNDFFEFDILGASNLDVTIYNRWGEAVYSNPSQTNGIGLGQGWDGTAHGKPAPFDTYVYRIIVTYWDGADKQVTGTVTLMK